MYVCVLCRYCIPEGAVDVVGRTQPRYSGHEGLLQAVKAASKRTAVRAAKDSLLAGNRVNQCSRVRWLVAPPPIAHPGIFTLARGLTYLRGAWHCWV